MYASKARKLKPCSPPCAATSLHAEAAARRRLRQAVRRAQGHLPVPRGQCAAPPRTAGSASSRCSLHQLPLYPHALPIRSPSPSVPYPFHPHCLGRVWGARRWTTWTRSWSASPPSTSARRTTSAAHTWQVFSPLLALPHSRGKSSPLFLLCRTLVASLLPSSCSAALSWQVFSPLLALPHSRGKSSSPFAPPPFASAVPCGGGGGSGGGGVCPA
jgi:hypothetical protein